MSTRSTQEPRTANASRRSPRITSPACWPTTTGSRSGRRAIAPRGDYPRLGRSATLKPVDDEPVWSVVCFYIKAGHRRQGVSSALLKAAVRHAKAQGARIVEGYPVDPCGGKVANGDAYTGVPKLFRAAGFTEVLRRSDTRPIMRVPMLGLLTTRGSWRTARGRRGTSPSGAHRRRGTVAQKPAAAARPERRPAAAPTGHGPRYGFGHREDLVVVEVVGDAEALVGVADHPEHARRAPTPRPAAWWRSGAAPARAVSSMSSCDPTHQPLRSWPSSSTPSSSHAADDLVVHDALVGLQLVAAHAAARAASAIAASVGQVGVVHGRPVDRPSPSVPHRQVVADREGLAVADHHADDRAADGTHERTHVFMPGLREADLVARAVGVGVRARRAAPARACPSPARRARCPPRRSPRRTRC